MLILPASDKSRAVSLLRQVADSRERCHLVVFGDDERAREIASRADVRAEGHPFRRVVLVPSTSVLEGEERFAHLCNAAAGQDVVGMSISFQVVITLVGDDALRFSKLERAFAKTLGGVE